MSSDAEKLADALLARTIDLARIEAGTQQQIRRLLAAAARELVARLTDQDPTAPKLTAWRQKRLEALHQDMQQVLTTTYRQVRRDQAALLAGLAAAETEAVLARSQETLGAATMTSGLSEARLRTLLDELLLEGAPAQEWWSRQAGTWAQRLRDTLRQGMVLSDPLSELVTRVQDTAGLAAREAEALVRTSLASVANATRLAVYERNRDVVRGVQWLTTLDTRSCVPCLPLSALVWTLDHAPVGHTRRWPGPPPLHWQCRCVLIPALVGVPPVEDRTFDQWLQGQSEATQQQVLGPQRYAFWKAGTLKLTQLTDQHHQPLTLEELRGDPSRA